jgi:hypothetical protein
VAARSAALEPVMPDVTGEHLAQALAGLSAGRPRVQLLQEDTEQSAL